MAHFFDCEKRRWNVRVTYRTYREIRDELNVDLFEVLTDEQSRAVLWDPLLWTKALWIACRRDAEKASVSEDEFYDALDGDSAKEAFSQMLVAIKDFFPSGPLKEAMDVSLETMPKTEAMMNRIMREKLEELKANLSTSIEKFGESQEPQESPTQEGTPSEN